MGFFIADELGNDVQEGSIDEEKVEEVLRSKYRKGESFYKVTGDLLVIFPVKEFKKLFPHLTNDFLVLPTGMYHTYVNKFRLEPNDGGSALFSFELSSSALVQPGLVTDIVNAMLGTVEVEMRRIFNKLVATLSDT